MSFAIAGNPDSENGREGTITIKDANSDLKQVITVKQPAYVPELVKMEYRPGWTWEEAHDNLPLLYYAHVDRDRYYSNGEVYTDHFVDYGHDAQVLAKVSTRVDDSPLNNPSEGGYTFPNQIVVDDELVDVKGTIEYKLGDTFEN